VRSLIVLVTDAEDLHGYAARRLFAALQQHFSLAEPSLMTASAWCIGEFGRDALPTGNQHIVVTQLVHARLLASWAPETHTGQAAGGAPSSSRKHALLPLPLSLDMLQVAEEVCLRAG